MAAAFEAVDAESSDPFGADTPLTALKLAIQVFQ
jgi:hypothetical protein